MRKRLNKENEMDKLKIIESEFVDKKIPDFNVGDTVKIMVKIPEGPDKTRLHPFEGVVIAKRGSGLTKSFTVRKISYGEGIERVFSVYSPTIEKIEIIRSGRTKRAKLYYLRGKVGKRATKIESKEEQ
jgi:large subunit ribosomal protein L19